MCTRVNLSRFEKKGRRQDCTQGDGGRRLTAMSAKQEGHHKKAPKNEQEALVSADCPLIFDVTSASGQSAARKSTESKVKIRMSSLRFGNQAMKVEDLDLRRRS